MECIDKRNRQKFMLVEVIFAFTLFLMSYEFKCSAYNTTLYAFNYGYGFISRAFIGSVYVLVDAILPVDMMSYAMAMRFTEVVTVLFYLVVLSFFHFLMKRISSENLEEAEYLILFFSIFVISMYADDRNFGRVDIYLIMVSLISAMLIIREKCEFLILPLVAIAVCVHQGYVFMFFNVVLVLLFYKILSKSGRERKKYIILFAVSFLIGSALFLYFEFFSRSNGANIYDEIVRNATILSFEGDYHETLIDHEILNVDLADEEWLFHLENFVQLPVFTVLMLPYLIILVKFLTRIVKRANGIEEKLKYLAVAIGSFTIIPNFILKVDYARWTMSIICYYSVVTLSLLAMRDKLIEEEVRGAFLRIKSHGVVAILLMAYPFLFVPFWDVYYDYLLKHIGDWLNLIFLHLW